MKRSDCFQRLWSCYHAATPDSNKWPWGDSEGMGITHLRKNLLTSDRLFHALFTSRLDCMKHQISAAPANGMGVISSSKVHISWLWTGQQDTCSHWDLLSLVGCCSTPVLWRASKSEITERQLAITHSFQTGRKPAEKALANVWGFCSIWHFFQ